MSGAMLECAICNARKWKSLEEPHEADLRFSGAARLFCDTCTRETYWLYSQNESGAAPVRKNAAPPVRTEVRTAAAATSPGGPVPEAVPAASGGMRSMQTERRMGIDRRGQPRRIHRRVQLQVPVRVRIMSAGAQNEEVTRTVNVCKNGIYIQTERPYPKGASLFVAMNYSPREPGMTSEQKATVVRVDSLPGTRAHGVAIQLQ